MGVAWSRSYNRNVLRSYIEELRRIGAFDGIRARASVVLAPLLDHPHSAPAWIESAPLAELLTILTALRGRDAVRELGYQVMKRSYTKVLEPIIHFALSLVGASPAALFSRANAMASVISRGLEISWASSDRTSGTMRLCCEQPAPEPSWVIWEGTLVYMLELAGARGVVQPGRIAADGRSCEIGVNWEPK